MTGSMEGKIYEELFETLVVFSPEKKKATGRHESCLEVTKGLSCK